MMAGETVDRFEKIGLGFIEPNTNHDISNERRICVHLRFPARWVVQTSEFLQGSEARLNRLVVLHVP